jgi:orotidine-5'-phosphate decarboxylase
MNPVDRIVVALDRSARGDILRLAEQLHGVAGILKIGLQAFVANGPELVRELIGAGHSVFVDLKFHDIPNTAGRATGEAAALGARITNVHAAGGRAMLEACAAAVQAHPDTILLGVTILTSLERSDLEEVGISGGAEENVVRLATLCRDAGLHGVVSSAREISAIREACGEEFVILTPGIRPAAAGDDQKRTMTAGEAIARGATYIVVGRPITDAADPRAAASRLLDEIS